jgi:uncharacterized membrane protein YfcA
LDGTLVLVLAVIFFATVIRSAFGFGEALIAVPLLALVIPVEEAVPLATLISITVAALILLQDWHKVHLKSALGLVLATVCGIPFGLWLLTSVEEVLVKSILAVLIISFSTYCLAGRGQLVLHHDRLAWLFGFAAGIFGGAYGMNGPPLVIYGSLRRWTPEHFRATLQGYFLPASLIGLLGYWLTGLWVGDVTRFYLLSLPVALLAMLLGHWLNRRMTTNRFLLYVHVGLIVVGGFLLAQALWQEKSIPGDSLPRHGAR